MFKDRNNHFEPANNPPVYMPTFGFSNGAQYVPRAILIRVVLTKGDLCRNDAFDNGVAPRLRRRAYPPSHYFMDRARPGLH